jgi:hypothetical protein
MADMGRDGLTKSGWLILWPASFFQTAVMMKSAISSSVAPERRSPLRLCSWREKRQVRR